MNEIRTSKEIECNRKEMFSEIQNVHYTNFLNVINAPFVAMVEVHKNGVNALKDSNNNSNNNAIVQLTDKTLNKVAGSAVVAILTFAGVTIYKIHTSRES